MPIEQQQKLLTGLTDALTMQNEIIIEMRQIIMEYQAFLVEQVRESYER